MARFVQIILMSIASTISNDLIISPILYISNLLFFALSPRFCLHRLVEVLTFIVSTHTKLLFTHIHTTANLGIYGSLLPINLHAIDKTGDSTKHHATN